MFKRAITSLIVAITIACISLSVYAASDLDFIHANAGEGTQGEACTAGTWNTSQQGYRVTAAML